MEMQQPKRERAQNTLMILEPTIMNEFFARRISAFLRKLTGEFQKTQGRTIPMHRAYALASPTFTREECYDVLKALRDKKILNFSVPHGITITSTDFSSNVEQ
jgi:hypothetical protein